MKARNLRPASNRCASIVFSGIPLSSSSSRYLATSSILGYQPAFLRRR